MEQRLGAQKGPWLRGHEKMRTSVLRLQGTDSTSNPNKSGSRFFSRGSREELGP